MGSDGLCRYFFALEGYVYLEAPVANKPLIISHRGVSNKNGVQNTVQSLEKPLSYLQISLRQMFRETKDGQFVMMHDANIKNLTGVNANPQDLTLEEINQNSIFQKMAIIARCLVLMTISIKLMNCIKNSSLRLKPVEKIVQI